MQKQIFVYVDLQGTPQLVGRLWTGVRGDRESATFEYEKTWLNHPERFSLEPALKLGPGPFHAPLPGLVFLLAKWSEWRPPLNIRI